VPERRPVLPARALPRRLAAAAVLALCAASCPGEVHPARPGRGVLVIAIDALRADHVSAYGYDRPTMPRLEKLAEEGVLFEDAWSAAPELMGAHVALLTGCDPTIARRPRLFDGTLPPEASAWHVPREVPRLARAFLAAGYRTAAFVDSSMLSPVYGLDAGFEHFTGFKEDTVTGTLGFEDVGEKFTRWLQGVGDDEDWFAYLHADDLERLWRAARPDPRWETFFEARSELGDVPPVGVADEIFFAVPRRQWERGGILSLGEYEARYDGTLRNINRLLGRLFTILRNQGRYDRATIVVAGTYGIGFGESGLILDSGTLSDVDLHVPLVVKPAEGFDARRGLRSESLVSLVDVAPTLLDLSGLPVPEGMDGRSQLSALRGVDAAPARELAFASGGVSLGFAVIDGRWIYEYSAPGSRRPGPLVESWFGGPPGDRVEYRRFLKDRQAGLGPGDLGPSADDEDVAGRLHAAGAAWLEAAERRRDALHDVPWGRPTERGDADRGRVPAGREGAGL
jgi:arylsulfatase A-like enzyme